MSTAELAASYAALILADDGVEITVCQKVPEVTRRKKRSRTMIEHDYIGRLRALERKRILANTCFQYTVRQDQLSRHCR